MHVMLRVRFSAGAWLPLRFVGRSVRGYMKRTALWEGFGDEWGVGCDEGLAMSKCRSFDRVLRTSLGMALVSKNTTWRYGQNAGIPRFARNDTFWQAPYASLGMTLHLSLREGSRCS